MARVRLSTSLPIYPFRGKDKLLFPVGEFTTVLTTESFQYAIRNGHVVEVELLATFTKGDLFTSWVDYFYPLRQSLKESGNAVWEKTAKLMMNALYGKFGEKHERGITRCPDPDGEFYLRDAMVPRSMVEEKDDLFDPLYDPAYRQEGDYVLGTEWSCMGTYNLSAGEKEGDSSMVPIAAHVTDYGRMRLWEYMTMAGLENVAYVDTDSMIVPTDCLDRLQDVIDSTQLGMLKVEGESDQVTLRGAKDYTFGDDLRRKGIRSSAVQVGPSTWEQAAFSGLRSLLRQGRREDVPIGLIRKTLTSTYGKGNVQPDGTVQPFQYPQDEKVDNYAV